MDIRSIKRTKLGRQWLAEYVRRIWALLDRVERDALLGASIWRLTRQQRMRLACGLFADFGDAPYWPMTPLGREVARHGRRERARLRSAKKSG